MPRIAAAVIVLAGFVCAPAWAEAQAKDAYVRGLIDLTQAVNGLDGRDGASVRAALEAMTKGLAEWDAAVARVEAGFKGAIAGAAPPAAARMRGTLAASYLERGRIPEALVHLDRAAALDPSFVAVHLLRGLALARTNRAGAAATAFGAARALDPSPATAYLFLASSRGAGAAPARRAALDTILQAVTAGAPAADVTVLPLAPLDDASVNAPLFVPAAFVQGFRLLADARFAEALTSVRAVPSGAGVDERAAIAKADMLVAAGDRDAARVSLRDTVRRFPLSGQAHWRLGRLSEDAGDQAAALRSYDAAAGCAPVAGAAIVYAAIGRLHHTALDLSAAARAYERRVALVPQSARAHLDLGTIYQAQDRLDDALSEYLAAALVDPSSAAAFAAAGQLRADQGDDAGAVALLRAAVRLDARNGAARYALGRALLRAGKADEARQELAAFESIQKADMDAQRRQFEENSRAIESVLQGGAPKSAK
jgi:tetratricopeptide (TPR) repeat protein